MTTKEGTLKIYKKRLEEYKSAADAQTAKIIKFNEWMTRLDKERETLLKDIDDSKEVVRKLTNEANSEWTKHIQNVYEIETKIKNLTTTND